MTTAESDLFREGVSRRRSALAPRRAVTEAVLGSLFVMAAIVLAVFAEPQPDIELGTALALVAMFALGISVRIDIGTGYTSPVQLAFVPMLLLLPASLVPLLVMLGWFLGRLPFLWGRERMHPDRLLLVPADCWFSLGPALVLVLADAQTPGWEDWPVYLAALAAQFGLEGVSSYVRDRIGEGVAPRLVLKELGLVWGIDALLTPLGLLAAFATQSFEYAFLLLVPPAALIVFYSRERTSRLENALALADASRDRQALIAGASHELVTPLGVLVGLTDRLVSGKPLAEDRRRQLDSVMRREVLELRQIIRQFVDYTRLKTEGEVLLAPEPVALDALLDEVVAGIPPGARVEVSAPASLPPVLVDAVRARQMVRAVLTEALQGTDQVSARLAAVEDAVTLVVSSSTPPRERPFAEGGEGSAAGLGLYVTRELARLQGGDVTVEAAADGGAWYMLALPRA